MAEDLTNMMIAQKAHKLAGLIEAAEETGDWSALASSEDWPAWCTTFGDTIYQLDRANRERPAPVGEKGPQR